jgi:DNA-binding MarR family transcriptional regulator
MAARQVSNKATTNHPSVCTCVNVRRASRAITRVYDKALEPAELKITQFSVLSTIMHSGPLNISNLARILKLDRTTLVRNMKSLESSGFVENTAVSDPRERAICITESGRIVVERARHYWSIAQKRIEDHIGSEAVKQLGFLVTSLERLSDDSDIPEMTNQKSAA